MNLDFNKIEFISNEKLPQGEPVLRLFYKHNKQDKEGPGRTNANQFNFSFNTAFTDQFLKDLPGFPNIRTAFSLQPNKKIHMYLNVPKNVDHVRARGVRASGGKEHSSVQFGAVAIITALCEHLEISLEHQSASCYFNHELIHDENQVRVFELSIGQLSYDAHREFKPRPKQK